MLDLAFLGKEKRIGVIPIAMLKESNVTVYDNI
jgi:hypothetical protein